MQIDRPMLSFGGVIAILATGVGTCTVIKVLKDLHLDLKILETQQRLD